MDRRAGNDDLHTYVGQLRDAFADSSDSAKAPAMRAYMKNNFDFLGVMAPARRAAQRAIQLPADENLLLVARQLWQLPEREFQYAAVDALASQKYALEPDVIVGLAVELARQKSWWDTVDGLASVISDVMLRNRELVQLTEEWLDDENFWVARLALLHQNGWRQSTDEGRLFAYCLQRANDPQFFIRKAIGWALRDYAWTNPHAVLQFVNHHNRLLSALSRREAVKNIARDSG